MCCVFVFSSCLFRSMYVLCVGNCAWKGVRCAMGGVAIGFVPMRGVVLCVRRVLCVLYVQDKNMGK